MKQLTASALALVLVAAALSGCGKTSKPAAPMGTVGTTGLNGATAVDVAQTADAVSANPSLVNENLFADPTPMTFDSIDPERLGALMHFPLRWWRTIDSTSRSVDFAYMDPDSAGRPTNAIATVHRHLLGQFHVVLTDSTSADSMRRIVNKPLDDMWTRKLALHRFRIVMPDSDGEDTSHTVRSIWRIVGTSGVLVTSAGATVQIQSVHIQAGSLDTTITDPLELHRLRRFECLHALQLVHLTVTTNHHDDIVAFYRDGDRRPFTNNGDGTYSIDFTAWDFGGFRHLGVNAFANGTITSATYPYDSQAWLWPFVARDGDAEIDH